MDWKGSRKDWHTFALVNVLGRYLNVKLGSDLVFSHCFQFWCSPTKFISLPPPSFPVSENSLKEVPTRYSMAKINLYCFWRTSALPSPSFKRTCAHTHGARKSLHTHTHAVLERACAHTRGARKSLHTHTRTRTRTHTLTKTFPLLLLIFPFLPISFSQAQTNLWRALPSFTSKSLLLLPRKTLNPKQQIRHIILALNHSQALSLFL